MRTSAVFVLLGVVSLSGCLAGRFILPEDDWTDGFTLGGMRDSMQTMTRMLGRGRGKRSESDLPATAVVRFVVPPSESKDFEDAWLKLEESVMKDEKDVDIFDLKRPKTTNFIYMAYGEWADHDALHDHFHSDHFSDFAKFVDDHHIMWKVEELWATSSDLAKKHKKEELSVAALATLNNANDEEEVNRLYKRLQKRKDMAHVVFKYIVRPGEGRDFEEAWYDTAKDTLQERGNKIYSLRKVATDNSIYYGYGTWDTMRDYMDHFESKHLGKLLDYTDDNDVIWFLAPLEKIGHEKD